MCGFHVHMQTCDLSRLQCSLNQQRLTLYLMGQSPNKVVGPMPCVGYVSWYGSSAALHKTENHQSAMDKSEILNIFQWTHSMYASSVCHFTAFCHS